MTYYDTLGVPRYATPDQIKSAYRDQMKFFHPDVFYGSPYVADVKSKQLNEAYAVLSVPEKRYEYDEKLYADDKAHLQDVLKSRDNLRAQSAKDKSDNEKYVSFIRSELEKSTRKYRNFRGFAILSMFAIVLAFCIYASSGSTPAIDSARSEGYNAGFKAGLDAFAESEPESEAASTVSDEPLSEYDSRPVWITPSGSKYHLRSCSAISGHEVERTIRIEAEKAGYTACSKCKP